MPNAADEDAIDATWLRIERWMGREAPSAYETLAPGCDPAALAELETTLGVELPPSLRKSLRRHDGESTEFGGLVAGFALLGCRDIAYEWRGWTDLQADATFTGFEQDIAPNPALRTDAWWRTKWIPFVGSDGFNLCVDLDPGPAGHVGQIIVMDHEVGPGPVIADDFSSWLALWADDLEAGAFEPHEHALPLRQGRSARAYP